MIETTKQVDREDGSPANFSPRVAIISGPSSLQGAHLAVALEAQLKGEVHAYALEKNEQERYVVTFKNGYVEVDAALVGAGDRALRTAVAVGAILNGDAKMLVDIYATAAGGRVESHPSMDGWLLLSGAAKT